MGFVQVENGTVLVHGLCHVLLLYNIYGYITSLSYITTLAAHV